MKRKNTNSSGRAPLISPLRLWNLFRFLITVLVLFVVWLIFSFRLDLYSVLAGLVGSIIISALTFKSFIAEHEASWNSFLPNPFWLLIFFIVLVYFMYSSSVKMLSAVFTGRVSPRIVHFRTRLRSDFARMVLSNSITFTPGTITLDLNDDHLTVHWLFCNTLHAKAAGEEVKGRMEGFLRRVWG